MRCVVVTGVGLVSSIGNSPGSAVAALRGGESGVVPCPEMLELGMRCGVYAPVKSDLVLPVPRRTRHMMSDVARFAVHSALQALEDVLGDQASPLHERGEELREIIVRIRERNREVALLVRHSLVFIEDLIRVVTGSDQMRSDTDTAAGRTQESPSSALAAEG